jgi:tetratricopeptide (TPR) repeat protein
MHILTIILLVLGIALLVIGAIAVIAVLIRKLPTVALIDVKSVPVDKTARMKEQIIADRIVRSISKHTKPLRRVSGGLWEKLQTRFRKLAKSAFDLERRAELRAREGWDTLTAASRVHALIREGDRLLKSAEWGQAEKKYIQAVAMDMKNAKLYEKLGNLYLDMKQFDQAKETLRYASRLSPNDASLVTSLGEVALAQGQFDDAVTYFQHAVSLRPRSPRYLDFLLESCILGGNRVCAQQTLTKLITVNPENAKIHGFERRIREMV